MYAASSAWVKFFAASSRVAVARVIDRTVKKGRTRKSAVWRSFDRMECMSNLAEIYVVSIVENYGSDWGSDWTPH